MKTQIGKDVLERVVERTATALGENASLIEVLDFDNNQEGFEEWLCEEVRETANQLEKNATTEEQFSTCRFIKDSLDKELIEAIKNHDLWENLTKKSEGCWKFYHEL